ncbi:hypothetical protein DFH06DRAFT_1293742 [Mycena polygramma]|nr:hypothetical protein DFH06DRAFT_1293742 [Mycena polygramma]
MSQEAALDELFTTLSQTRQTNYVLISAVTFLAYDICITFDQEVKYIWQSQFSWSLKRTSRERWSLPKALYLFGRYYGLLDLLILLFGKSFSWVYTAVLIYGQSARVKASPSRSEIQRFRDRLPSLSTLSCKIYYGFYGAGGPILFVTALNILFILRIHALYNRATKMLMFLIALLFLEFTTELVIIIKETTATVHNTFEPPKGVHWPGCATTPSSFSELVGWVPAIFVSLMFFILTMVKFVLVFRSGHREWSLGKLREVKSYSPILMAFVLDGTVFFLIIFSTVLVNTITNQVLKGPLSGIAIPWTTAIYSFSASRLVLNIRSIGVRGNETTVTESISLQFRTPGAGTGFQNTVNTDAGEM